MQTFKKHRSNRHNLSLRERNIKKSLSSRTDVVIKPADKGVAIVIMDSDDYIKDGLCQLNDSNFYEHLTCDPTVGNTKIVTETLATLARQQNSTQTSGSIKTDAACY